MLRTCVTLAALVGCTAPAAAASPDPKSLAVPPEELSKARGAEACVLDPVDAVRHHSEGEAAAEGREYASATRQAVAP